jgi:hypothetical protein
MDDLQSHGTSSSSWLDPPVNASYQEDGTINPMLLNKHVYDSTEIDIGTFSATYPAIPHSQTLNFDSEIDREIIGLLRCATPDTKKSIRHLLRHSVRADKNSGTTSE